MKIMRFIRSYYFFVTMILSFLILSSAYIMEYFYNLPPCKLCVYQRIPYFLIFIVSIISIFFEDKQIPFYFIFLFFLSSASISLFHSLVERGFVIFDSGCSSNVGSFENIDDLRAHLDLVPLTKCDEIVFSFFGFSLANINFIISLLFIFLNLYFTFNRNEKRT